MNTQLKAVGDVIRYRDTLESRAGNWRTRGCAEVEQRYRAAKRTVRTYGIEGRPRSRRATSV